MRNRAFAFWLPLVAAALLLAPPASAVNIDWVQVGNPGNAPDTASNCIGANGTGDPSCGSVPYSYFISKYEVTNAQYAEFLNAKAASDPLSLYNTSMGSDAIFGGITLSGSSGSYSYAVKTGFADKPVTYVSFYDALRFANWLNNGQGGSDTETGAYTITLTGITDNSITRNALANTFLPSENEWYKAAYYSPGGVYFDYPTGTNTVTGCATPGSDTGNSANCFPSRSEPTNVGAYSLSDSPYGTYDQGGNVWEWNEQIVVACCGDSLRGIRGGSWGSGADNLAASDPRETFTPLENSGVGFRVASIPEPGTGLLLMTGLLGLAYRQTRRGRAAQRVPSRP